MTQPPTLTGLTGVAVVTGASTGIGAAVARVFADAGVALGLCARRRPDAPAGARAVTASVDVTDRAAVAGFADEVVGTLGPIDVWINNAGTLGELGPVRDVSADALAQVIDVNLTGAMHGSQVYVRHLHATGRPGTLIDVSSGAAASPVPSWAAYCASKAGLEMFTRTLAAEEAGAGLLTALSVAPGVVDTPMQAQIREVSPEQFDQVERFRDLHATGSLSSPEWVARWLLAYAFDPASRPDEVVVRLPPET